MALRVRNDWLQPLVLPGGRLLRRLVLPLPVVGGGGVHFDLERVPGSGLVVFFLVLFLGGGGLRRLVLLLVLALIHALLLLLLALALPLYRGEIYVLF